MTDKPKTNKDICEVAEMVLFAKANKKKTVTVNGVVFDDNIYDGKGGRCQENTRKVIEAALDKPMPGKACCAYKTYLNLLKKKGMPKVVKAYPKGAPVNAKPGDALFFSGGPKCHTCGNPVGHVGIWLGNGRMFQHTSRAGLGITQQPPTASQIYRFVGAYRFAPVEGE